jgi:hypothetical protein
MAAGKGKVPAGNKAVPAPVERVDAAIPLVRKNRTSVNRRQAQVARKAERPSTRQQEAISRLQKHRVGNAVDGQPTLAGNDRVALDAFMPWKLNRQVSTHIEATGRITARFQQRQHIGKRIHRLFHGIQTIAKIIRALYIDRISRSPILRIPGLRMRSGNRMRP